MPEIHVNASTEAKIIVGGIIARYKYDHPDLHFMNAIWLHPKPNLIAHLVLPKCGITAEEGSKFFQQCILWTVLHFCSHKSGLSHLLKIETVRQCWHSLTMTTKNIVHYLIHPGKAASAFRENQKLPFLSKI